MKPLKGNSYEKRLKDIIDIYDMYAPNGVTNTYIWRIYIYPKYGVCERTFYNYLANSGRLITEDIFNKSAPKV